MRPLAPGRTGELDVGRRDEAGARPRLRGDGAGRSLRCFVLVAEGFGAEPGLFLVELRFLLADHLA